MLFMVVPGTKLGPLNGPNCIPKDPPVETAWGTFDGERMARPGGAAEGALTCRGCLSACCCRAALAG